jgi:thiamine pyrophosphokinase
LKRAWIIANGVLEKPGLLKKRMMGDDWIVAVDGGLGHIRRMDLSPDLVIGDLDSIQPEDKYWLDSSAVEIIQYPESKDQTDLELALHEAQKRGYRTILILAALGGRLDHELANIFLLSSSAFIDFDIRILDYEKEIFFIYSAATIQGNSGDIVSLIPLGREVKGITTENLAYPLNNGTLYPDQARGISNTMTADKARVTVKEGRLICVHFFKIES